MWTFSKQSKQTLKTLVKLSIFCTVMKTIIRTKMLAKD